VDAERRVLREGHDPRAGGAFDPPAQVEPAGTDGSEDTGSAPDDGSAPDEAATESPTPEDEEDTATEDEEEVTPTPEPTEG
jgi:hypothetical protein